MAALAGPETRKKMPPARTAAAANRVPSRLRMARDPTGPALTRWTYRSNTDALCEQLAVVGGVAEEQLGGLGPLEVEVGVVLPGEADAAVDLDVLGGGVEVRLRAVRLGQAGH